MATRSIITAKVSDGTWRTIYCHYDGYPSHNGRILLDHYGDQAKVDALMALGSLSSLGASTEKPEGHTFNEPVSGFCVAYGRDRGEKNTEAAKGDTAAESIRNVGYCVQEFSYLWDGERWNMGSGPLTHGRINGTAD